MPLVTLIPYRPPFTLPLSLSHSVPPNSQEKFSQSPFPLSGYFAVGRRSRPLLGLARATLLPRARSFSQCIPLRFEQGPCFSWEQDQTDPQRCGRRTEYFTPLKRIPQRRVHLSRKRMAQERGERARPLPRAMLTYSLYPTIRGRVAPPPPPALARPEVFSLYSRFRRRRRSQTPFSFAQRRMRK